MPEWKKSHGETLLSSPPKPLASWYAPGLSDGLGDRLLMFDNSTAPSLELLRFHRNLAEAPGFEAALRERVSRLAQFRHPAFAQVRAVQRLEPDDDLALISNCTPGKRLSEILHKAGGPAFAAALLRQLAPALVLLQQHEPGVSHGALSPERIVVSPEGRLTIVEHVVGSAIHTLKLGPAQLASIGIALPATDGGARLDVATDWYQLGLVALAAALGRPISPTELPQLEALLEGLGQPTSDRAGVSRFMRQWLHRALQISGPRIESGDDARAAFDEMLRKERPGDLRLVGAVRAETTPSVPSPAPSSEPIAERPDRAAVASPPVVPLQVDVDHGLDAFDLEKAPAPIAVPPIDPPSVRPPIAEPPTVDARASNEPRDRPVPVRTLFGQAPAAPAGRQVSSRRPPAPNRPPATAAPKAAEPRLRVPVRAIISTGTIAALALFAAVEAGVIALLARALWLAPPPAIVSEMRASGGEVLVTGRSAEGAPLRLTVAPDLSWIRVASASSNGVFGGKAPSTAVGTIRIASPIELKVLENSRLLGSVPGADLRIPAGRHVIELVNPAFKYRLEQTVDVEAGQILSIHVSPPHGWVNVYSTPDADVSIDGQRVGRTPLGPVPLALGEHTFTFQHPTGAKDRTRATVSSGATIRVMGNPRR